MTLPQVDAISNRMGWAALNGFDEILGIDGLNKLLSIACTPETTFPREKVDPEVSIPIGSIHKIMECLESVYGVSAGRGLGLRIGRASLKYMIREFEAELGFSKQDFRFLPLPTRLTAGIQGLADLFNKYTDMQVQVNPGDKLISWNMAHCPFCQEHKSSNPCCFFAVGLIQEAMYWVSGGKYYQVEETGCIACGDRACTITIDRSPVS